MTWMAETDILFTSKKDEEATKTKTRIKVCLLRREFQTRFYCHWGLKLLLSLSSSSSPSLLRNGEQNGEKRDDDDDMKTAEAVFFLFLTFLIAFNWMTDRRFCFEDCIVIDSLSVMMMQSSSSWTLSTLDSPLHLSCSSLMSLLFYSPYKHDDTKIGRARVWKSCHLQTGKTGEGRIKRTRNLLHHPLYRYILQGWPEDSFIWCPSSG